MRGTLVSVAMATTLPATDAPDCKTVRMADLGSTDIAPTNATANVTLKALGCAPEATPLGIDVDVFEGDRRPVHDAHYKALFDGGSAEVLSTNPEGATFTPAVPRVVANAGVEGFGDLAAHADQSGRTICAIKPGNNQPLIGMVAADQHGLGGWTVVETSEAGMLAQVDRTTPKDAWIVFLGWNPHPTNLGYDMTRLDGGDVEHGPDLGGSMVWTISRRGKGADCPNAADREGRA